MTDKDLIHLTAMANALKDSSADVGVMQPILDEIVGESYAKELAAMTEAEAVQHLRSISGEKLSHAYLVMSVRPHYALRADHPVLAEVCLRLMASAKVSDRITGVADLGVWLGGTNDKNVSRLLALKICDDEETDAVRSEAYISLELINNKTNALEGAHKRSLPTSGVHDVDWNFVRSFL